MVPPALAVLFAPSFSAVASPPGGASADADRINAASLLLGFEMTLFALSFVLAFMFLAVSEGRRRGPPAPGTHITATPDRGGAWYGGGEPNRVIRGVTGETE